MPGKTKERLFNKNFLLLITVSLITAFGYSMMASLVSSYAMDLGASLSTAGVAAGIFSLAALVSRPFSGYATDLFNKKTICTLATGSIALSILGYLVAPNIQIFLLVRVLHGIAFGVSGTANLALVSEYIPDSKTGEGLGYFGIGQVIAQVAGPSLGVYIRDSMGYQMLYLIITVLTAGAVLILLFFSRNEKKEKEEANKRTAPAARQRLSFHTLIAKECIVYALVAGLFSAGNGIVNSFLIPLGEQRSIANISLFFSANALVLFLMRLTIGKLIDKTKLLYIVIPSLLISALSFAIIGYTSSFVLMMAAAVFKALGHGGGQISLQSACIKRVSAARVGVATGTFYIGADIGQGLGSIVGGQISDLLSYDMMFYCAAALMVAATIAFTFYECNQMKAAKKAAVHS